jgi:His-Xaa-Ser system protein HxsD
MKLIKAPHKVTLILSADIYTTEVLHKCLYWYSGNYIVCINHLNTEVEVSIQPKETERSDFDSSFLQERLSKDLIDFKLREVVSKETRNIRDLIVAKAFAYYDSDDSLPSTEVADPVGFDIKNII